MPVIRCLCPSPIKDQWINEINSTEGLIALVKFLTYYNEFHKGNKMKMHFLIIEKLMKRKLHLRVDRMCISVVLLLFIIRD